MYDDGGSDDGVLSSLTLRRGAEGTAQQGTDMWTPPPEYRGFVARALFYM